MINERAKRLATFQIGTPIRLADGQEWVLPPLAHESSDPVLDETLRTVVEAEDKSEQRRRELALTILLLSRNYDFSTEEFQSLLTFTAGDRALREVRDVVHQMVLEAIRTPPASRAPEARNRRRSARKWAAAPLDAKR